jgi:hypothetical protein
MSCKTLFIAHHLVQRGHALRFTFKAESHRRTLQAIDNLKPIRQRGPGVSLAGQRTKFLDVVEEKVSDQLQSGVSLDQADRDRGKSLVATQIGHNVLHAASQGCPGFDLLWPGQSRYGPAAATM